MNLSGKITESLEAAVTNHRASSPLRAALNAGAALYGAGVGIRNAVYNRLPFLSHAAQRPVISIGGIRAGGAGKTPVAAMIGEHCIAGGVAVAFLSRGFRRQETSCRIVRPGESVLWSAIGDEPALLYERLPRSWLGIDPDRNEAAKKLSAIMPERSVFILDDGFQHRSLRRDLDIVCLHDSFSNDRLIPSGYLREPISELDRAHIALLIGPSDLAENLMQQRTLLARRFPHLQTGILFQERGPWVNAANGEQSVLPPLVDPVLICGIARPERFITMVRQTGIIPSVEWIFSDHHPYVLEDFKKKHELYLNGVITTEKDAVRLKTMDIVPIEKMWYLKIRLRFADTLDETAVFSRIDKASKK